MHDTDVTDTRAVQLRRCGFTRTSNGWARGSLVISDATLAGLDAATWAQYLRIWRQRRR
jgi:hypothetical protein